MSDFLREISAKIGFQVDTSGVERVNEKLEGMHRSLEVVAGAEILRGLFEIAERFGGLGEELETAAASAGITTEAFQQLSFAAAQSGVGSDKLGFSLNQLSRQIEAAREGSEGAANTFGKLGISPEQLAGFANSEEALKAVADRIAAIEDPIKRTQAAMKIFGRGGAKMVRFLGEGSEGINDKMKEASALGAVLTGQQVESLAELEDTLSALGAVIKAAFGTIATYAAPIIKAVVADLESLWQANRAIINTTLEDWFASLAYAIGFTVGILQGLVKDVRSFAETFPNLAGGISGAVKWLIILSAASSAVTKVFGLLGNVLGIVRSLIVAALSPFGLFVIAIGTIITVSHDLWALWKGGNFWKDTWIGQALTALDKASGGITSKFFARNFNATPQDNAAVENEQARADEQRQEKYATFGARLRGLTEITAEAPKPALTNLAGASNPVYDTSGQSVSFQNVINVQAPVGGDAAQLAALIQAQFDQSQTRMMQQAKDVLNKPRVM